MWPLVRTRGADLRLCLQYCRPVRHFGAYRAPELRLSDTAIGFLTGTVLAIFYTGMGLPLGLIADRVDRRKLISISIAVWSIMTAACGIARNFVELLLARI